MRRLTLTIALLLFVTPVQAAEGADFAAVVENAISGYIMPAYQHLHEATGALTTTLESFCAAPAQAARDEVASVFAATIAAWARVDFFRFGPVAEAGRYERFAFWPDVHGTGARQLRQFLAREDQALLLPGALEEQSAAVQGLPALESLLYSGEKALLTAETPAQFRCALAVAVAQNLNEISEAALAGWSGEESWRALIGNPGSENPVYRTHKEAMTEILKAILTGLEQDRDHRLLPALGATLEEAKASNAPYNRSGQALPYLLASLDALESFVGTSRILDLLPEEERAAIANSVHFEFGNARAALQAAGPDLEAALLDRERWEKLSYAALVLASLRDLFQNRISAAAGISAGFNALDGD